MDDKAFELLTKMYSEFSEFRKDITDKVENNSKEIQTVGNQVNRLENGLKTVGNQVNRLENGLKTVGNQVTRLENKLDTDVKALFDGYKQTYEKLEAVETKLDTISMKLEKQDVELKVLKGGK